MYLFIFDIHTSKLYLFFLENVYTSQHGITGISEPSTKGPWTFQWFLILPFTQKNPSCGEKLLPQNWGLATTLSSVHVIKLCVGAMLSMHSPKFCWWMEGIQRKRRCGASSRLTQPVVPAAKVSNGSGPCISEVKHGMWNQWCHWLV